MTEQPRRKATWERPWGNTFALFPDDELNAVAVVRRSGNEWLSQWRGRKVSAPLTLRQAVRRIEKWAEREGIEVTNPGMPNEEMKQ